MKVAVLARVQLIDRSSTAVKARADVPRQVCGPAKDSLLQLNKLVAVALAALSVPMCYGADYTADTAPDAASKSVLAVQVMRPEEGAMNADDIAPAIHRNFPRIIEQNLAARSAGSAMAYIDNLSDLELDHLAQLYVNANASAARSGKLL